MGQLIPKAVLCCTLASMIIATCVGSTLAQSITLQIDKTVNGDTLFVDVKIKESGMTVSGGGADLLLAGTIDLKYDPNYLVYKYHATALLDKAVYESYPREETTTGATYGLQVATPTLSLETAPSRVPNPASGSADDVCDPPEASCTNPYVRTHFEDNDLGNPVFFTSDVYQTILTHKLLIVTPPAGTVQKTAANPIDVSVDSTSLAICFVDETSPSITDQCCRGVNASGEVAGFCIIDNPVLLPVELSDFSAVVDNGDVVLNWQTASESNNAGFSIEHAVGDEGGFEEVGYIDGAGNSREAQSYTYTVKGLDIGKHRFRLKQLDFDGAFEYSEVVETTIELAGTHRLGAAYPNPFNPSTTFELVVGREQHVKIDIINALGQRVQRLFDGNMEANKPTNFTFQAGMLPTGLYFYRVVGENFAQTRQVLLVK